MKIRPQMVWLLLILALMSVVIFLQKNPFKQTVVHKAAKPKAGLTLVYQVNRESEIEPCGCETNPYGGMDREFNALEELRKLNDVLYVDGGNTLAPILMTAGIDYYRDKAKALVQMLNKNGLSVFAPGPTDYALGAEFLRELQNEAQFKFVSTNVIDEQGRPLFAPYQLVERDGIVYGVVSITPETVKGDGIKVEHYMKALDKWLPEVRRKSDFIIALSQLGDNEKEKALAKEYPDIQVWVGSDAKMTLHEAIWVNDGKSILVDGHQHGYQLGKLSLKLNFPFKGIYSPEQVEKNQDRMQRAQKRLKVAEKDTHKLRIQNRIKMLKTMELEPIAGGSKYNHELIKLDKERYGKPNEVTELITKEKERVRQKALQEG